MPWFGRLAAAGASLTRRITRFFNAASRSAAGDPTTRSSLRGHTADDAAPSRVHPFAEREAGLLQTIIDTEPECVKLVGPDGRLLDMNPAGLAMIEADSLDQVKGRSLYSLVDKEYRLAFKALTDGVFRGERGAMEFLVHGLKGASRWLETHAVPLRSPAGEIVALLGITRDVTDRKRAEEALRKSERTFETLIKNLPGVVYRCRNDKAWTTVFVSDVVLGVTGYRPSDFLEGRVQIGDLIHRDDQERIWNMIQNALAARESYQVAYRIRTAGGEEKWMWERGQGIHSDAGELLFLEGFVLDITERKLAEEALRRSHEDLEIVQERAHLGSWVLDLATLTGTWSREMCRLHGRDPSQEAPSFAEFLELIHPKDRQRLADTHAHLVQHGGSATFDYRTISDGRPERVINATAHCVKDADGNVVRMVGTNLDVTDRKQAEGQIRTLIGNVPGAVYRCGYAPNWTIEFMSDPIHDISGYPASDFVNDSVRSYVSIIEPADWPDVERIAKERLSQRRPYEVEYRIRHADGSWRWIYEKGQGVFNADGTLRWLDGVIIDVTAGKQAEAALRESEERYRRLVNDLPGTVYRCKNDPDWTTEFVSDGCLALTGYARHDIEDNSVVSLGALIHPDDRDGVWEKCQRNLDAKRICRNEYRIIRKDGTVRWVWDQAHGIYSSSGELRAIEGFITDITERKKVDQELREHGQRLQMLTERLVKVQEEEARRIGRELHDDLGQILTMLKIKLQTRSTQEVGSPDETRMADLTASVDQAIERVRALSTELRPVILDDLGLAAALRWMLDRQSRVAGFQGTFAVSGVANRLAPELETTCYRVAQEAVTNVVRHARAAHVRVDLERIDHTIRLRVSDDGVGFDAAEAFSDPSMGKSLGLVGMRERVELMKGLFSIQSSSQTGTIVQASFVLPGVAPAEGQRQDERDSPRPADGTV